MEFEEIIKQYSTKLFNMVYGMVGEYNDASDITQDALFLAYKSFPKFRGEAGIYTWLYRIAKNECNKYFNKNKIRGILFLKDESLAESHPIEPDIETRDKIRKTVANLPLEYRETIVLKYFNDMSYEEIAETQGIPVGTVRSRLARGRVVLEKKLKVR